MICASGDLLSARRASFASAMKAAGLCAFLLGTTASITLGLATIARAQGCNKSSTPAVPAALDQTFSNTSFDVGNPLMPLNSGVRGCPVSNGPGFPSSGSGGPGVVGQPGGSISVQVLDGTFLGGAQIGPGNAAASLSAEGGAGGTGGRAGYTGSSSLQGGRGGSGGQGGGGMAVGGQVTGFGVDVNGAPAAGGAGFDSGASSADGGAVLAQAGLQSIRGDWTMEGVPGFVVGEFDTRRSIGSAKAKASPEIGIVGFRLRAAHERQFRSLYVQPVLEVDAAYVRMSDSRRTDPLPST